MIGRASLVTALLVIAGACATGARGGGAGIDPRRYDLGQDPVGTSAWQRASGSLRTGDDVGAIPELLQLVRACPDFVRGHLAYQDAATRLGGAVRQAMVDHYTALPLREGPVAAYCRARLLDTDYAQDNALAAILVEHPSFAWAHLSRARVSRQRGRLLPSLDMYSAALVHDAKLFEARLERAQVLVELGRDMEAVREYRDYLDQRADDVTAIRDFVTLLLYRVGRTDEATPWLAQLEARLPGDVTVRMDRAAVSWRERQHRAAVDAYVAILRDDPGQVRAALNIGLLLYEVVPTDAEADRRRYWPAARAAFRWFLDRGRPADGHGAVERTLGVPFRLQRIAELLGPETPQPPRLDDLAWPASG